jgi:hypothetical protein
LNHNSQNKNEEGKSSRPAKKKIFKRQHPTTSEIETITVDQLGPESLRKKEDDQFKIQTTLPVITKENDRTEIESTYLVKSENISKRLVQREPSFEASDPVDDVGDSL